MRHDPQRTSKRNCGLCWKAVDRHALDTVQEGITYFHRDCHRTVLAQRVQIAAQSAARQVQRAAICFYCEDGEHEHCMGKRGRACQCGC